MRKLLIALLAGVTMAAGLIASPAAAAAPANDGFAAAEVLAASGSIVRSNVGATTTNFEPSPDCCSPEATIWFSWTAPASGRVTFDTWGSDIDTVLAVWTGTTQSAAVEVASDDDGMSCDTTSFVQFDAVRGTRYRIQLGSWDADDTSTSLHLTWNWSRTPNPPGDDIDDAVLITPGPSVRTATVSTAGATTQDDIPAQEWLGESSVWLRLAVPTDGVLSLGLAVDSRANAFGETAEVSANLWGAPPDGTLVTWLDDGDTEDIDLEGPAEYYLQLNSPEICLGGRATLSYRFRAPSQVATSRYTAAQYALVSEAAARLRTTVPDFQHDAVLAWQFIYGLGGASPRPMAPPTTGRRAATSEWAPGELPNVAFMTSGWSLPVPETQQVAALGLAFLLSMSR